MDTAHGHSSGVIERVRWVKQHYPQIDVIGGNIATGAAALAPNGRVFTPDMIGSALASRAIGETMAVTMPIPALGPSLGTAPSGRWMCRSFFW